MQATKKHILSTGLLDDVLTEKLRAMHELDVVPFIRIEPVHSQEIRQQVELLSTMQLHVVFTSNNAVMSVADLVGDKPVDWKLFSIEGVTSRSVETHFGSGSLAATAFSGEALADRILETGDVREVVFFCGDLRRRELPQRLSTQGVKVSEVIVYNTVATPVSVERVYDAILFFSPSSVYSYVAFNEMPEHTVCFAIGNTTANTLQHIVPNKIVIAQPPQKERVVEMLIEYYSQDITLRN